MASRPPPRCPLCHEDVRPDQRLVEHLSDDHTKRELARAVVSEHEANRVGDSAE